MYNHNKFNITAIVTISVIEIILSLLFSNFSFGISTVRKTIGKYTNLQSARIAPETPSTSNSFFPHFVFSSYINLNTIEIKKHAIAIVIPSDESVANPSTVIGKIDNASIMFLPNGIFFIAKYINVMQTAKLNVLPKYASNNGTLVIILPTAMPIA